MNARRRRILRVISSILMGLMAFFLGFLLTFVAGVFLFAQLQTDFLLMGVLVIFLVICTIVGLIVAVVAGVKYYRHLGKTEVNVPW